MSTPLFNDIKVITNPFNNGKSKWLIRFINIFPNEFRYTIRITNESGNVDSGILQLPNLIENRFSLEDMSFLRRLEGDIVSNFTMHEYLLISDNLRQLGFVYNKKTKEFFKNKKI